MTTRSVLRLGVATFLALSSAAAVAAPNPEPVRTAAATITDARCRAHVDFLASDALEGRATPSRGLDVAGEYVSSQFERFGLEPGGDASGWFQPFPVLREVRLVSSTLAAGDRAFQYKQDYIPLSMTAAGTAEGPLAFAGYGITNPDTKYDDYASIDVKGKIVLVLRHEPREKEQEAARAAAAGAPGAPEARPGQPAQPEAKPAEPAPTPEAKPAQPPAPGGDGQNQTDPNARPGRRGRGRRGGGSRNAYFEAKIQNAAKHGAVALLLVTDPANHTETAPEGRWPSMGEVRGAEIPAFHVSLEAAKALLGGKDLLALQKEIDKDLAPKSFDVGGARVRVAAEVERVMGQGRNVVGILRGTDPKLADEAVVIGAHYDHVGMQTDEGPGFPGQIGGIVAGDKIHNGADDNASGTAALLEVARAFGDGGVRPARTMIFVAFAGEELGLLGSAYYVKHPLIQNERTAAMINLDMVGRNALDEVILGGVPDAALQAALDAANGDVGMKIQKNQSRQLNSASDHASFQKAGIPNLFFFSGDHPDYHRVTDDRSKIEGEKIARIAKLAFLTAAAVADDPQAGKRPAPAAETAAPATTKEGRLF